MPNSFKTTESSFSWLWGIFGKGGPKTRGIEIPKYVDNPGPMSVQLSTALQYGEFSFSSRSLSLRRLELTPASQEPPPVSPPCSRLPGTLLPVSSLPPTPITRSSSTLDRRTLGRRSAPLCSNGVMGFFARSGRILLLWRESSSGAVGRLR